MQHFFDQLLIRAATIDELLSDDFEALPGQKQDTARATERLAAWCRAASSGDWSLFSRRLACDGFEVTDVLSKFSTVRRSSSAPIPLWLNDAIWILDALEGSFPESCKLSESQPIAFEDLFAPLVEEADKRFWASSPTEIASWMTATARTRLRSRLLEQLSDLAAPALYDGFLRYDSPLPAGDPSCQPKTAKYHCFITDMRAGGLRRLFDQKPVLLRLIATLTRHWLDTSTEFTTRLQNDGDIIRDRLLSASTVFQVTDICQGLSDPHNGGHSVSIVTFEDGTKILYKPKDLGPDAAFEQMIGRMNHAGAPIDLRAPLVIARDGYGWTEFIEHCGCHNENEFSRFFHRAGAWLAIFHSLSGADMHYENIIASGDHPIPIDLEMILQGSFDDAKRPDTEGVAFETALKKIENSVSTVGLVRAYATFAESLQYVRQKRANSFEASRVWAHVNTDDMRPEQSRVPLERAHLPHVGGRYCDIVPFIADFTLGFELFSQFLQRYSRDYEADFESFARVKIRRVMFPTRFYYGLLERLSDYRTMHDGIIWSVQADFLVRLVDWDLDEDPLWPLQFSQRRALWELNVPYFFTFSDGSVLFDEHGPLVSLNETPGLKRAFERLSALTPEEIVWQSDVIKQETSMLMEAVVKDDPSRASVPFSSEDTRRNFFLAESTRIADEISNLSIRADGSSAWIGIDRLRDSEAVQLVPLSNNLYAGTIGIALFFAAHAKVTGSEKSAEMAISAISNLRRKLRSKNAPRMARFIGTGGIAGLGSIVFGFASISQCLGDAALLEDAQTAANLFTEDLIIADCERTIIDGNAGGLLALLKLYRVTGDKDALHSAIRCGEHLLSQRRVGDEGRRTWPVDIGGNHALNGMSHGAAGFSYAFASLHDAAGRAEFAQAAHECIAFETVSFDAEKANWPDLTGAKPTWPAQWCHGAAGIGLARAATFQMKGFDTDAIAGDIRRAFCGVEKRWPNSLDTLCCGTLGVIEFCDEAGLVLDLPNHRSLASERLFAIATAAVRSGDYRWNSGARRFNLGLFRGLAGVGYTMLRRLDSSLPNVLTLQ